MRNSYCSNNYILANESDGENDVQKSSQSINEQRSALMKYPERILGLTKNKDNQLMFMIKWSGSGQEATLVPSHQARCLCPQLVIDFYQEHINFNKN